MNDWISKNAVSLAMAFITLVSSYAVHEFRVSNLEDRVTKNETAIAEIRNSNHQTLLSIVAIQKDIEFIRLQLSKLVN